MRAPCLSNSNSCMIKSWMPSALAGVTKGCVRDTSPYNKSCSIFVGLLAVPFVAMNGVVPTIVLQNFVRQPSWTQWMLPIVQRPDPRAHVGLCSKGSESYSEGAPPMAKIVCAQ